MFVFNCFKETLSKCSRPALPFPAFDNLNGKAFPVFELTEEIVIDEKRLDERMDVIYKNHRKMTICSIVLTTLAFSAFIFASLFSFVYHMNNPVRIDNTEEDVANKERLNKITKHQNFEMEFEGQERKGFLVE